MDDEGKLHLGALSAGCLVWGILMSTMGLKIPAFFLAYKTRRQTLDLGKENEERWRLHFNDKEPNRGRMFGAFLILLRAVANGSLLVYSAWILPPRNPDQNLNLSKFLLAWFEAPLAFLMAVSCLFSLVMIYWKPDEPQHYAMLGRSVRRLGRFSAFSSLPYANPAVMLNQLQVAVNDFLQASDQAKELGVMNVSQAKNKEERKDILKSLRKLDWWNLFALGYVVFSQMVYNALFACAAIGSVVVKTSQMSFVSERPWDQWTVAEGIALASFINALSGLGLDPNVLGLVKVRRDQYTGFRSSHLRNI